MSTYQLLYQSFAQIPFEPRELNELLHRTRARNQTLAINGLLLYTPDGRFLQVLEGPRANVRALYYEHILRDPRHFSCRVLCEGACETPSFDGWAMAFRPAQAEDLRRLLAPVPVHGAALLVPRPHTRPELVELLVEFMQHDPLLPAPERVR